MEKKLLALCALLVTGAFAQSAMAIDSGVVTFAGAVTATTCTVKVNGGTNDATVQLPVVSTQLLDTAGKTAGRTPFTFALSGCGLIAGTAAGTPLATQANVYFRANNASINPQGMLDNTAPSGATNVDLEILGAGTAGAIQSLNLNGDAYSQGATTTPIVANAATITHYVQYHAVGGAAGAGPVASSVQYDIIYQ